VNGIAENTDGTSAQVVANADLNEELLLQEFAQMSVPKLPLYGYVLHLFKIVEW
jgi:hypothetical protein